MLRAQLRLFALAAAAAIASGEAPVQLISGAGELLTSSATSVAATLPGASSVSVVASVGGSYRGRKLLNAVFGTSFDDSFALGAQPEATSGAWIAASPSTGALVLDTRPIEPSGESRSPADSCKLASFSLAVADAVIVHSPCVAPSAGLVKETYERLFSHHIAARRGAAADDSRTLFLHVSESADGLSEGEVVRACKEAWAAAAAATEMKGKAFSDLFDLEVVVNDESGVSTIRSRLSGLGAGGSKVTRPGAFADVASTAWQQAGTLLDGQPSETWLRERYLAARSYEDAYTEAQELLRRWSPTVAKGKLVGGFGPAAAAMLDNALASFDAGVSSCSAASGAMLAQRRARLAKALQNDAQELFTKQHRQLTLSTMSRFKAQLVKVMSRAGSVAEWQQEGLRRNAEKHFDACVAELIIDGVGDVTRAQLTTAFGKQLTELTSKFIDSPPMQLQAIAAMRRKTGKGQKSPRGIRAGVGLVGAVRSAYGGGQGNLQTYAGYTEGLNSAHIMFANDGLVADSSGSEPPFWRWQPKMNFDISI
jgi:hypothetical protein